jgi:electron transport complex protein RnfD
VTAEGLDVGFLYLLYHLLSGEMLLAAFFLATEMTSRPVTTGGQVIFGLVCGVIAALLKLYVDTSIPAYLAVLVMNTFTPTIDAVWRPRVFGQKRFWSRWFSRKPSWN